MGCEDLESRHPHAISLDGPPIFFSKPATCVFLSGAAGSSRYSRGALRMSTAFFHRGARTPAAQYARTYSDLMIPWM